MDISQLIEKAAKGRWSETKAWTWYNSLKWLVGCNFIPSSAINQLEMWQADTFNPAQIDRELGWLAGLGMNSMRVFLHNLPWENDPKSFLSRVDQFLDIAHRNRIGIMFVFFDSCWNPHPVAGPQRGPKPGVHNSYWLQSPGIEILRDPQAFDRLEDYVRGVVSHYRDDARVQAWDVWNEPNNPNTDSYGSLEQGAQKNEIVPPLLSRAFQWVRSAGPTQPVTSGVWTNEWVNQVELGPLPKLQLAAADVISFHCYEPLEKTQVKVERLKNFGRPVLCTEYMARGAGNTFQSILPFFKKEKIAAYNWGAVAGKTQTQYPWDSWQKPYSAEPKLWHHDIFRPDGSPYDPEEAKLIKSLQGVQDT